MADLEASIQRAFSSGTQAGDLDAELFFHGFEHLGVALVVDPDHVPAGRLPGLLVNMSLSALERLSHQSVLV